MKRQILLGIVLLILGINLLIGTNTAQAAGDFINNSITTNGTCNNTSYVFSGVVSWSVTVASTLTEIDIINGSVIYNNTGPSGFGGSGTSASLSFSSVPYSASQPYTIETDFLFKEGSTVIGHYHVTARCINNVAVLGSGGGGPGAPIPAGFVLRTITCDTPVYETAGGIPVPTGEHIINGQTWFVNPTAVQDAKHTSWTEIFAGGFIDGFIPTACVGGKPAGYGGA